MTNSLVIVALPKEDDYIYKISSEKVPHLTLLFLGEDATKVKNLAQIFDFVGHAASHLTCFGLEVDHRGTLGPEEADVLFFSKTKWSGYENVAQYRSFLLKEPNIRTAYDSATQFPEWVPHLTLGSPANPAHEDTRDYPGTTYVQFDKIAVWFGDYEGIEYPLKKYDSDMEIAYSDLGQEVVEEIIEHHGVKGQKWGVRKSASARVQGFKESRARAKSPTVTVTDKGRKLKTTGGKGHAAHPEAVRARTVGQIAKKSGPRALSNAELKLFNERLNLEQNYKRLTFEDKSRGAKFVDKLLGKGASRGVEQGTRAALSSSVVKKTASKGAAALAVAF